MTTSSHVPTAPPLTTCPGWCTLPPDHGWDSLGPETGVQYRGHGGPAFGHVFTSGDERSDNLGTVVLDAGPDSTVPDELVDFRTLRDLAEDCRKAADWIEAHQ